MSLSFDIRKLRDQIKQKQKDDRHSRLARSRADIRFGARFCYQAWQGGAWLYQKLWKPIQRYLAAKTRLVFRLYRRLWGVVVYRRDEEGVLLFSKTRAGAMLLATGIFVIFLALPLINLTYDTTLYVLTAERNETVYLLGSQEINSISGEHVIEGCSALPCSDRDAVYFRSTDSLFNNIWSLLHGKGVFYPEYVGAAVPYSLSRCVITSYGIRVRFPFRLVNTYSNLLEVTCRPV